jgi:hypothetical protein
MLAQRRSLRSFTQRLQRRKKRYVISSHREPLSMTFLPCYPVAHPSVIDRHARELRRGAHSFQEQSQRSQRWYAAALERENCILSGSSQFKTFSNSWKASRTKTLRFKTRVRPSQAPASLPLADHRQIVLSQRRWSLLYDHSVCTHAYEVGQSKRHQHCQHWSLCLAEVRLFADQGLTWVES